jgi:hypothetical protein
MISRRSTLAVLAFCLNFAACGGSSNPSANEPFASASGPVTSSSELATTGPTQKPVEAAPCTKRDLAFDPANMDLTGAWLGNDNGVYYLRQIDRTLWWNGMSGQSGRPVDLGREWNNVAVGEIKEDLTIELQWADVPRGEILGSGTLIWEIGDDGTGNTMLTKVSETGTGFGGVIFTPCAPG